MKKLLIALTLILSAGLTQASQITYAGSWNVGDGPAWNTNPLAYSGVGAAKLLFGAGDYEISTVDNLAANINNMAHYAVIGIGFRDFADTYFRGIEGTAHYKDVYIGDAARDTVSTYVSDFGRGGMNYAFRVTQDVPEPASLALLGLGLIGLAATRRRKL